jgi:hypothetical protein
MPINPHSRLAQRGYNLNHPQCAVAGCTNPPRSGLSGLCDRHRTAFRRLGHYEQEFPTASTTPSVPKSWTPWVWSIRDSSRGLSSPCSAGRTC